MMSISILKKTTVIIFVGAVFVSGSCTDQPVAKEPTPTDFIFGSDMSSVNQVLDHGGIYKDGGATSSPYRILKDRGNGLVRLRLWHNPTWTKTVYGDQGTQLYNDPADVALAIQRSREQGMKVMLDFHYSDTWADPGKQIVPDAWKNVKSITVLADSVYNYTKRILGFYKSKDLLPDYVQIGNEINCGMLSTDVPAGFPACNVCSDQWANQGELLRAGIRATREVSPDIKIALHVADPKNLDWWFGNITTKAGVSDFDIIGFSYYPLWHTTITLDELTATVASLSQKYNKPLMILETAYPWTTQDADSYANIFGAQAPIAGYPFTVEGQMNILKSMTQKMIDGGGVGMIYWEPAWISSQAKDLWGTGSSWDNNTYFDFDGNTLASVGFMKLTYSKK
jgi:arabinogalactan endo-1,4-beta-galactosidase